MSTGPLTHAAAAAAYAVGHQQPSPEEKSTSQLPNSLSQDMRPPWMVTTVGIIRGGRMLEAGARKDSLPWAPPLPPCVFPRIDSLMAGV